MFFSAISADSSPRTPRLKAFSLKRGEVSAAAARVSLSSPRKTDIFINSAFIKSWGPRKNETLRNLGSSLHRNPLHSRMVRHSTHRNHRRRRHDGPAQDLPRLAENPRHAG